MLHHRGNFVFRDPREKRDGGSDGALFGAIASLFGSAVSAASSAGNAANSIAYSREAATTAYNRQIEFWNMQNEYNTPVNQLARMKEAGINPNMAISGGYSNTASAAPSVQKADSYQQPDYRQSIELLSNAMSQAAQIEQLKSQSEQAKSQAALIKAEEEHQKLQNARLAAQNEKDFAEIRDYWDYRKYVESTLNGGYVNNATGEITSSAPEDYVSNPSAYTRFDGMSIGSIQGRNWISEQLANNDSAISRSLVARLDASVSSRKLGDDKVLDALASRPKDEREQLLANILKTFGEIEEVKSLTAKYNAEVKEITERVKSYPLERRRIISEYLLNGARQWYTYALEDSAVASKVSTELENQLKAFEVSEIRNPLSAEGQFRQMFHDVNNGDYQEAGKRLLKAIIFGVGGAVTSISMGAGAYANVAKARALGR